MNFQEIQNEAFPLSERERAVLAQSLPSSPGSSAEDRVSMDWPLSSEEAARKAQKRAASWRALMRHVQSLPQSKNISEKDIAYEIDQVRNAR